MSDFVNRIVFSKQPVSEKSRQIVNAWVDDTTYFYRDLEGFYRDIFRTYCDDFKIDTGDSVSDEFDIVVKLIYIQGFKNSAPDFYITMID